MHVYKVCITAEDDAGPPVDRRFEELVVVRITTLADLLNHKHDLYDRRRAKQQRLAALARHVAVESGRKKGDE